jgi:allantoinase
VLDMVASDHSPCSPNLKAMEAGDFVAAWGGVDGTPASWLVGPDGAIRAYWLGALNLSAVSARIEALLAARRG